MVSVEGEVGLALKMATALVLNSAMSSIFASVARNTMDFSELVTALPSNSGIFGPMIVAIVSKFFTGYSGPQSMAYTASAVRTSMDRWGLESEADVALASLAIGAGMGRKKAKRERHKKLVTWCKDKWASEFFEDFFSAKEMKVVKRGVNLCDYLLFLGTLLGTHVTDNFFWIVFELTRYDIVRMLVVYKLGTVALSVTNCFLIWLLKLNLAAGIGVMVTIICLTFAILFCVTCLEVRITNFFPPFSLLPSPPHPLHPFRPFHLLTP